MSEEVTFILDYDCIATRGVRLLVKATTEEEAVLKAERGFFEFEDKEDEEIWLSCDDTDLRYVENTATGKHTQIL